MLASRCSVLNAEHSDGAVVGESDLQALTGTVLADGLGKHEAPLRVTMTRTAASKRNIISSLLRCLSVSQPSHFSAPNAAAKSPAMDRAVGKFPVAAATIPAISRVRTKMDLTFRLMESNSSGEV